ncbi:MAG: hypothetical protein AB1925_05585 [Actinomycetota bacterium]
MYPDVVWDDEVDVVCTDVGPAGVLCAVAASARGGDVLMAAPRRHPRTWFETLGGDSATSAYASALVDDIDVKKLPEQSSALPVRAVQPYENLPSGRKKRTVPAFDGGRLRRWAGECIASPLGYLYTRVTGWPSSAMQSADGDTIDIVDVCAFDAQASTEPGGMDAWLQAQVRDQNLVAEPVDTIERLVFEDTTVSGVIFATADGPLAVRARHGVLLCGPPPASLQAERATPGRLALVGRTASRFGRVELLVDG